ncbi:MAG: hypothetical protein ACI841_004558 [Planctomycetota bacterium]
MFSNTEAWQFKTLPANALRFSVQSAALIVVQSRSRPTELFLQHAALLEEVVDDVLLMAIEPA